MLEKLLPIFSRFIVQSSLRYITRIVGRLKNPGVSINQRHLEKEEFASFSTKIWDGDRHPCPPVPIGHLVGLQPNYDTLVSISFK